MKFLAFADRELAFRHAVAEIELQRDNGHALLLNLDLELIDFAPIQEKLALPERIVISGTTGQVLGNMRVYQPSLGAANFGESVANRGFTFAKGLDLGANEYQACLERSAESVVVGGGAVLGDDLNALVLLLFFRRFHGVAIIAAGSDKSQGADLGGVRRDLCSIHGFVTGMLNKGISFYNTATLGFVAASQSGC
jgi:hypothetical protein